MYFLELGLAFFGFARTRVGEPKRKTNNEPTPIWTTIEQLYTPSSERTDQTPQKYNIIQPLEDIKGHTFCREQLYHRSGLMKDTALKAEVWILQQWETLEEIPNKHHWHLRQSVCVFFKDGNPLKRTRPEPSTYWVVGLSASGWVSRNFLTFNLPKLKRPAHLLLQKALWRLGHECP